MIPMRLASTVLAVLVVSFIGVVLLLSRPQGNSAGSSPSPTASADTDASPTSAQEATSTPTDGTGPPATEPAAPTPPATEPVPQETSRETPEADPWAEFWSFVPLFPPVMRDFDFGSLEEMYQAADVVLVGRVADVYIGEQWVGAPDEPAEPFEYARIEVVELLKGEPATRQDGALEMQVSIVGENWVRPDKLPDHEVLLFLVHEASWREAIGKPARDTEIAPFAYFIPSPEGAIRNVGGDALPLRADDFRAGYPDHYAVDLIGVDFAELVESIRALAPE